MRVTQSGKAFAFAFDSLDDVHSFNAWLDEAGHPHSKLPVPQSRQQRRLVTKAPTIIRALDEDAVRSIRARWID